MKVICSRRWSYKECWTLKPSTVDSSSWSQSFENLNFSVSFSQFTLNLFRYWRWFKCLSYQESSVKGLLLFNSCKSTKYYFTRLKHYVIITTAMKGVAIFADVSLLLRVVAFRIVDCCCCRGGHAFGAFVVWAFSVCRPNSLMMSRHQSWMRAFVRAWIQLLNKLALRPLSPYHRTVDIVAWAYQLRYHPKDWKV